MLVKAGSKLDNVIDDRNRLKAKVAEQERLAEEYNNMPDSDILDEIDQFAERERHACIKRINVSELIAEHEKLRAQVNE